MLENISIYEIVGSYISGLVKFYLILNLDGMKDILKNKKFWIAALLFGIYIYISFLLTDNAIKVILEFITTILLSIYILGYRKSNLLRIIINCFILWVFILLLNVIFSVFIIKILRIEMFMYNSHVLLKFVINAIMYSILLLLFLNRKIRDFVQNLSEFEYKLNNYYVLCVIFLSVCIFSISVYLCLFNYDTVIILITLFIMIFIYALVVIVMIRWFVQKNKIKTEYDLLLTNLSEYENLLDIQRISNHENKNQLLVIKGMINKKDKNVSEYIDTIIDTQYVDNEMLIMKTNRIPSGGLRGLIYYKILTMKEEKIECNLEVDKSLKNLDFNTIPIKINQELCKIVGVFLDNAIQALSNLDLKLINILLRYDSGELIIKISNNYIGNIDLDKMDNKGYTTKGIGHGYGLSLVKSIIRNNPNFINEKEINRKMFTQVIKLKI